MNSDNTPGTIFSLILGLCPPRYFALIIFESFELRNIGKIKPLKDNPRHIFKKP